jgi:hypothetical protein
MRLLLTRRSLGEPWNRGYATIRRLIFGILVGLAAGCATGGHTAQKRSQADVAVIEITPSPGSDLQRTSVIEATVEYAIDWFRADRNRYYLAILFETPKGGSFAKYRDADWLALSAAHGAVRVTYALSDVWDDARLKKPIKLWFCVAERSDSHSIISTYPSANKATCSGCAGPIQYTVK